MKFLSTVFSDFHLFNITKYSSIILCIYIVYYVFIYQLFPVSFFLTIYDGLSVYTVIHGEIDFPKILKSHHTQEKIGS